MTAVSNPVDLLAVAVGAGVPVQLASSNVDNIGTSTDSKKADNDKVENERIGRRIARLALAGEASSLAVQRRLIRGRPERLLHERGNSIANAR